MADEKNADRSSIEIKNLARKLHPDRGNHRDRVRALTKFRNYVMNGSNPEFYDDDIPLLWLGNAAPPQYLDPDDDTLSGLYGLLQACGSPASEGQHDGNLKRSARNSMELTKQLLLDWKEEGQKKGELNLFAISFLSLPVQYYSHIGLEAHCRGDDRGGAKLEAFQIIALILTKHLSEDGEDDAPVMLEDLLGNSPKAQQEFELWSARHIKQEEREIIQKNAAAREQEVTAKSRQDNVNAKKSHDIDGDEDGVRGADEDEDESDDEEDLEDDIVAAMRKRRKNAAKEVRQSGDLDAASGAMATRWEDSQVAREQRARAASAAKAGRKHETVRDSQEAAKEELEREEEKNKVLGKDPLEIKTEDFDLRDIEKSQAEQMEAALVEIQEELQKAEATGIENLARKVASKKESIEALMDRLGGLESMETGNNLKKSILPTSFKFDPILFLTLVHRNAPYETLVGSLGRLSSKTENQVEQLENLVRENFPLFIRCSLGFDEFRQNSQNEVGLGVTERIDKLEAIAESCAFQAKKSFRPLLDNTTEVRKVQSAIAVLQRVAPVLQAPAIMRQHLENRRYSQALKTYRRVLVVDESCKIDLLIRVRGQAEECVREARRDLERRLAQEKVTVDDLLDGVRDLSELLELDVPVVKAADAVENEGSYQIGEIHINVRDHSPALACLLLQAAHFSTNVKHMISEADEATQRIFAGESLSKERHDDMSLKDGGEFDDDMTESEGKGSGNQWKYDVLDARVLSTVKAVGMARVWLPRLVSVGQAAKEDEKRRAARIGRRRGAENKSLRAFEVFITNVTPSLTKLIEHASFCALGSNTRSGGKEVVMTFGQNVNDRLRNLLRSPLPPAQSSKVGKELAELVEIIAQSTGSANALQPDADASIVSLSPLDECRTLGDSAVTTIEKRRCVYAFDVCARATANRASGSGKFDADALLNCLSTLAHQLSRPEDCVTEIEKGCQLVVRRCCEGLANYVRDRGDTARLSAVSECAEVISHRIKEIVREVKALTSSSETIERVLSEDVIGLEVVLFDEYLDGLKQGVAASVKVGWLDSQSDAKHEIASSNTSATFPAYLSASLLAIVRCRAQVEQALGNTLRTADNVPYQRLCMTTVAEGVVEGLCNEVLARKSQLKVRQADRLANELEFLSNTLKKFLGGEAQVLLTSTLQMVNTKAGRGQEFHRDGPDGLAALEELERLGRVYALCLLD